MSRATTSWTAVAAGLALAVSAGAGMASADPGAKRHQVSPAPSWAQRAASTHRSAAVTSAAHAKVWLAPHDAATLKQLAVAVSTPGNASYGDYLSEQQYAARFAPTRGDVAAVSDWARSVGLTVESVGPDNHYVAVGGSVDSVSAAFTAGLSS